MPPELLQSSEQTPASLAGVRSALLAWYARERRDFPWRGVSDPYAVLVSEVMLQQTQASRVAERFPRFIARFPSVAVLAAATPAQVLAEWSGLGYNRRAVALRAAAAQVTASGWPRDVAGLERLPGVGPYTARAIASLAFGQPVGVVDTNVRRWLVRRFRVEDSPKALQAMADRLAVSRRRGDSDAATWTHATMELGARVCMPRRARCDACPIAAGCPSHGAAPAVSVARHSAYTGSRRARRGAVLRALAAAPDHRLPVHALGGDGGADVLEGLERDALVHRSDGFVALGAATIGP